MLTLEQLFPTKLIERDPARVNAYIEQLPEGRAMMIEAGEMYMMVRKCDHTPYMLDIVKISSEGLSNITNLYRRTVKLDDDRVWKVTRDTCDPHNVGVALHPYPGNVDRGNPQLRSGRHVSFDLGRTTPYPMEWYPNYGDVEEYWPRHHAQLGICIVQIYTMRMLQPCMRVLKGEILDQCVKSWIKDFKRKYDSVYGASGYRLRKLTIASQNALTRFIIWMRRYTDSIWRMVPIEICRLIAAYCRPYAR